MTTNSGPTNTARTKHDGKYLPQSFLELANKLYKPSFLTNEEEGDELKEECFAEILEQVNQPLGDPYDEERLEI